MHPSQQVLRAFSLSASCLFVFSCLQSLVTADGLQIEHSSGTQGKRLLYTYIVLHHGIVRPKHLIPGAISLYPLGVCFWKVGSRKIYVINMNTHARADRGKGRKHPPKEASTSDSEEDIIPARKRTISSSLASVTKDVSLVCRELKHLFEINRLTIKDPSCPPLQIEGYVQVSHMPVSNCSPGNFCTLLQKYIGLQQLC